MNIIDKYIDYLVDNSTPDMLLWNKEALSQGKKPSWNYIDGCMMNCLIEYSNITKNDKYYNFVKSYVNYFVDQNGVIKGYEKDKYALDDICASRILFALYAKEKDPKYLDAIKYTYSQIESQPRTLEGNFIHKAIYPNQVWLDGFYMVMPFYTKYINMFKNRDYSDVIHMYKVMDKYMYDSKAKLYYHGYDESRVSFWANKETGLSKSFWLRAEGWFLCSLVDIYEDILNIDSRAYVKELYIKAIKGILKYLNKKENMFYQVINEGKRVGNYLETSGSSMVSYSILKAVRLGILPASYRKIGLKIFNGIKNKYLKEVDGTISLGGICLVAGLGPENNKRRDGSFEYYISELVVSDESKGIAPFIMAYLETLRCNDENRN